MQRSVLYKKLERYNSGLNVLAKRRQKRQLSPNVTEKKETSDRMSLLNFPVIPGIVRDLYNLGTDCAIYIWQLMAISKRKLQPNKKGDKTVSKFDNKIKTLDEALAVIPKTDSVIMMGGFVGAGEPTCCIEWLIKNKISGIKLITNEPGLGGFGRAMLYKRPGQRNCFLPTLGRRSNPRKST